MRGARAQKDEKVKKERKKERRKERERKKEIFNVRINLHRAKYIS